MRDPAAARGGTSWRIVRPSTHDWLYLNAASRDMLSSTGTAAHSLPLRDPNDASVLASAVAGNVDLLVTGDEDLLSLANRAPLSIVNPRGCWDRQPGRRR